MAHMLAFEAALARALGAAGVVPPDAAGAAAAAIEAHRPDLCALREATARDGVPVPGLVAQLRAASPRPEAVHRGATSQDVIDMGLALTLCGTTDLLAARLGALADRLDALDARFGANPLMGRTRMQAAEPITVSDRLSAWRRPLDEHAERLAALRPRVERLQLGGAVGNRAALGDAGGRVAAHMAAGLGLHDPPRAWHATRTGIAEHASALALLTGSLGKMGLDVCLMAQQGVDAIALRGGGASSAMAHKRNPVPAELLVALARFDAVQVSALHHAVLHEQERSGAARSLEWMVLPQMASRHRARPRSGDPALRGRRAHRRGRRRRPMTPAHPVAHALNVPALSGSREPETHGRDTLADVGARRREVAAEAGLAAFRRTSASAWRGAMARPRTSGGRTVALSPPAAGLASTSAPPWERMADPALGGWLFRTSRGSRRAGLRHGPSIVVHGPSRTTRDGPRRPGPDAMPGLRTIASTQGAGEPPRWGRIALAFSKLEPRLRKAAGPTREAF